MRVFVVVDGGETGSGTQTERVGEAEGRVCLLATWNVERRPEAV